MFLVFDKYYVYMYSDFSIVSYVLIPHSFIVILHKHKFVDFIN